MRCRDERLWMRFVVALMVGLLAAMPLTDADIWWHLASGRLIWESKNFIDRDVFTYTAYGQPWTNVHWLYQLFIYGVYSLGESWGLIGLHALCWAGVSWLWIRPRRWSAVAGFSVVFWLVRFMLLARPLALTLLIWGIQTRLLEREMLSARRFSGSFLAKIGFLQILLANIQGLFALSPIYAFWRWPRRFGISLYLWTVSAVNPAGAELWLYPWRLLGRLRPGNLFAERVAENISPVFSLWGGDLAAFQASWGLLAFTAIWIWSAYQARSRERVRLALPWLILAWMAQRNILLAYFCVSWPRFSLGEWRLLRWAGFWLPALLGLTQMQWWLLRWDDLLERRRFPVSVAEQIARYADSAGVRRPLRVFCVDRFGGYLSWKLYPRARTHLDTRFILRDSLFYARYLSVLENPGFFEDYIAPFRVDMVVVPVDNPPIYRALTRYLRDSDRWKVAGEDEAAVWFLPLRREEREL